MSENMQFYNMDSTESQFPKVGTVITSIFLTAVRIETQNGLANFCVYAAPQDLTDKNGNKLTGYFDDCRKALNQKSLWNGYSGECYANEAALMKSFRDGTNKGGWTIPPFSIVEKLYESRRKHAFATHWEQGVNPNRLEVCSYRYYNCQYLSCTESPHDADVVLAYDFYEKKTLENSKTLNRGSVRPVRFEKRL
jgi:hypothetical protein